MNIIVFLKMVPDVVEELKIGNDGLSLDDEWLRLKLNNSDEQALEQAVILKERYGGSVTAIALDSPEIDESLFMALAKGCDKAVKIKGDWSNIWSPAIAKILSEYLNRHSPLDKESIVLAGAQAIDDIEGELIYYLAELMKLPVDGVVTAINYSQQGDNISFTKEFSGGLRGEFEMTLPAIIGVQAAETPPRYIPIAKIRSIMKTEKIEEIDMMPEEMPVAVTMSRMYEPAVSERAEMLDGSADDIASKIVDILTDKAII